MKYPFPIFEYPPINQDSLTIFVYKSIRNGTISLKDVNNEKASDSFILDYNEYETMCEVNIVEQELDETPDADSDSNDEAIYELYSKYRFDSYGCVENVINEYGTEEEALKALHAEIELVIKAYEMKKPDSHWQFSSPTWRAKRGQEYYHLEIRKVK